MLYVVSVFLKRNAKDGFGYGFRENVKNFLMYENNQENANKIHGTYKVANLAFDVSVFIADENEHFNTDSCEYIGSAYAMDRRLDHYFELYRRG